MPRQWMKRFISSAAVAVRRDEVSDLLQSHTFNLTLLSSRAGPARLALPLPLPLPLPSPLPWRHVDTTPSQLPQYQRFILPQVPCVGGGSVSAEAKTRRSRGGSRARCRKCYLAAGNRAFPLEGKSRLGGYVCAAPAQPGD